MEKQTIFLEILKIYNSIQKFEGFFFLEINCI